MKQETVAQRNLERQGFEVFFPQYKKAGPKGKGELTLPLFSGYLFVCFDRMVDNWRAIHSTTGVSKILGYDAGTNMITPCRDNVIPGLQVFCDCNGIVDMAKAFPPVDQAFSQGEVVKILSGMFKDHTATYWNNTKNGAMLILSLLNRPVRVILRNEEITR